MEKWVDKIKNGNVLEQSYRQQWKIVEHIVQTYAENTREYSQADFKWIKYIKSIFDEIGLSFIWNDQIYVHIKKDLL